MKREEARARDKHLHELIEREYREGKNRLETKMIEVTPPIEPTVPEKKKLLTPFRFDVILLMIIIYLGHAFMIIRLVEYLVPEPTTNTVIVKVKEKVIYKSPVKKVKKPISCANK